MELLYATGLRVGELVSLNIGDVDKEESFIRCLGKGSKERIVHLYPKALTELKGYLKESRAIMLGPKKNEPALFINHRGERLTRQWVWTILKNYAQKGPGISSSITPPTRCVTASLPTCCKTGHRCATCRSCSAIPAFPPPRFTRT